MAIRKRGNKYCVVTASKPQRTLGCHSTKAAAQKQLAAVEISKKKRRTGR